MFYPQVHHPKELSDNRRYVILACYIGSLILFGFLVNSPEEVFSGIMKILTSPDTLITDYMGVGGRGAALVNAGTLTLIILGIFYYNRLQVNGVTIACLFTVMGFGLFGKNLFNIWFIVLGVYLYTRYTKKKFKEIIYPAFFATALAPVTSEIIFTTSLPALTRIFLAIFISLLIGFILPPVSVHLLKTHQGFNLYNMGFAAGVVGTVVVSLITSYGIVPEPKMIWTTDNNTLLSRYLLSLFLTMIILGIYLERNPWQKIKNINQYAGELITDFVLLEGFGATLINMGVNGCLVTLYIIFIGGELNGPTLGGIFTVVGFSALGKHPRNILPLLLGIALGAWTKQETPQDATMQLAALFGTTLAPIAGKYGLFWGIAAGFLHSSVVRNVGVLHGGLNLYNNGLAAGIVAAILVPIFEIFRSQKA
jgi:hypothetical protein